MNETVKPWYKQLWPWLIMLPPFAAVVGGIVTLILAGGPPVLVNDEIAEQAIVAPRTPGGGDIGRND
jgi:hypothetical protein